MCEEGKQGGACGGGCGGGCGGHGMCKCLHHKMVAMCALLVAVLFLLGDFGAVSMRTVEVGWPLLLGIGALTKLCGGMCKCCRK